MPEKYVGSVCKFGERTGHPRSLPLSGLRLERASHAHPSSMVRSFLSCRQPLRLVLTTLRVIQVVTCLAARSKVLPCIGSAPRSIDEVMRLGGPGLRTARAAGVSLQEGPGMLAPRLSPGETATGAPVAPVVMRVPAADISIPARDRVVAGMSRYILDCIGPRDLASSRVAKCDHQVS